MTDDRYSTCKSCLLEIGLEGCRQLGTGCPDMPSSILPDEIRGGSGERGVGMSVQGIEAVGERINNIMTHLAAPPFNKKLRGM